MNSMATDLTVDSGIRVMIDNRTFRQTYAIILWENKCLQWFAINLFLNDIRMKVEVISSYRKIILRKSLKTTYCFCPCFFAKTGTNRFKCLMLLFQNNEKFLGGYVHTSHLIGIWHWNIFTKQLTFEIKQCIFSYPALNYISNDKCLQ